MMLDKWMEILDMGGGIDVVCFDFMKAFDRVPHVPPAHGMLFAYVAWVL